MGRRKGGNSSLHKRTVCTHCGNIIGGAALEDRCPLCSGTLYPIEFTLGATDRARKKHNFQHENGLEARRSGYGYIRMNSDGSGGKIAKAYVKYR
jgi:hypothetical protein